MLHFVMTARFKYVEKAYDIAFDIGIRIGDAVPDSGLSRQIDNDTYSVTLKNGVNYVLVRYGSLYERPFASGLPGALFYFGEPAIFDIDIIIVSNRVYPDYRNVADVAEKTLYKIAPDKPGRPCHKDRLTGKVHIRCKHD